MNAINISVNKACAALLGIFCTLSAGVLAGFYLLTGQAAVLLLGLLYIFLVLVCGALFIALIRQKLLLFSDTLCQQLDRMAEGETILLDNAPGIEPSIDRLSLLPDSRLLKDQVLVGAFFYDAARRRLKLQPLSIITETDVIRLLY